MFLGTYEYTMDSKGRLFIPVKLREGNETKDRKYIVTRGLESCLYVYDPEVFQKVVFSRLENLPVKNQQDARAFKRLLLSGAQDVTIDDMGRLLVPKPLIQFANLKKDITILGVGERIELWSAGKWKGYSQKASGTFQKLGKQLEI